MPSQRLTAAVVVFLVAPAMAGCARASRTPADLVITRAAVWTGNPAQPDAMGVAIIGDRIVAVGGADDIERWRGPDTKVINAAGRRVVPGFNDAHVHFVDGGRQLDNVDLRDAATPEEFARRIGDRAKTTPRGEWILGGDWDDQRWTPAELPTRELVDTVTPSTPVFVNRYDGHMSLANSAALALAGAIRPACSRTRRWPMETGWQDQAKLGLHRSFGSAWLRVGAVKGYADGSLGSTIAYFFEPYTDAPNTRGLLSDEMQPLDAMRARLIGADRAGLQLCIHAIGDAGISQILDLFGDVARANGGRERRWRIEHAQHIAPKDFDRFASLGVIASVQPYHAIDDGRWAERRIGPERIKTTYAFRTLLDKGVRLALGTDWSVAPLNPMLTLYGATTRATLDGKYPNGWVPEQKITIAEATSAYTAGSAYAEFQDRDKGTIARGKLADLVVLSDDIFTIPPASIKDVKVMTTIVGGKVVYQR
jgi:predicted amidohydrolase YtcJ